MVLASDLFQFVCVFVWCSSTNLSELAKAIRLLAALHPTQPTGDELLKAAQALAGATAGLLNSAQPENMEVSWVQEVGYRPAIPRTGK